jgi:hypothetical protein
MTYSAEEYQKKLQRWQKKFPKLVTSVFKEEGSTIVDLVRTKYLSGQVLNARTGRLRSNIHFIMKDENVKPRLLIGTDVKSDGGFGYGAYWFHKGRDFLNPAIKRALPYLAKKISDRLIKGYNEY